MELACCALVALAACLFYFASARQPGTKWAYEQPNDYYGLQTAGFRAGHLYAAIEPNPLLLALPDPYDPVANAPYRIHDMSLYRGHYYLYFGVAPVLLLFWPVAKLTGLYVTERAATAVFCTGAAWAGIALLAAVRRRYFPAASSLALLAGCVCLAFATPVILLVQAPEFYQVAISCAIFMQVLTLGAIYLSMHSRARPLAWMAAAGLFFGLSIASRPNYLASCLILAVPALRYARANAPSREDRARFLAKALAFTLLPTAVCGVGLLAYNWERFGSATEFGMHYQLGGEEFTQLKAMSVAYLLPHAAYYLFNPALWQSYFPFLGATAGQPYGLLRYLPWSWLLLAAFLRLRPGESGAWDGRRALTCALAGAFLANLAFLSCFFGTTARYPGDFANSALLLAGVGALSLSERASRWRLLSRSALGLALAAAAAVSLFSSLAVYADSAANKDAFLALARALDTPGYAWQRAHGVRFGGLRLEVRLPAEHGELPEPLFETGFQSERRDWLQIDYPAPGMARLGVFHAGTGALEGDPFPIPADGRLVIEVRSGSLLPPYSHPVFSGWSRADYDAARRDLQVRVNGTEVLRASFECYDSTPANMTIGRLKWAAGVAAPAFTGEVLSVSRLPLEKPERPLPALTEPAPVEITLYLPVLRQGGSDPIILTGKGAASDLLYCTYLGQNRIRFGFDHFGAGGPQSEAVAYDPMKPHTLAVCMGPLSDPNPPGRLVVVFDGRCLINVAQGFYPASPASALLGFNAFGSSAAGQQFTGRVARVRQVSLASLPPPLKATGGYGAVEMSVLFPYNMAGYAEPLVVTGREGAGDFVFVSYVDSRHVVFGFDHWGYGGPRSEPVEVDYGQVHRISVTMDSLYPPGSPPPSRGFVRVSIDGQVVLDNRARCFATSAERISVGENTIGGSTCRAAFSGRLLSIERFARPRD